MPGVNEGGRFTGDRMGFPDRTVFALEDQDPDPVEVINPDGRSPFVVTCEHAGRAVPGRLDGLGLAGTDLDRHIAWDIGVDGLGRMLAGMLDAPVVLQRYSRLVIDCNRPLWATDLVPEVSDGTAVPANRALSEDQRTERARLIHAPFHDAVAGLLDRRAARGRATAVIALHSFTPRLRERPEPRPWHLGILYNRDAELSEHVHGAMKQEAAHLPVAFNEPYRVEDDGDYTIPVHGEQRGLPHTLLEVRNDRIAEPDGQRQWADLLTVVLEMAARRL